MSMTRADLERTGRDLLLSDEEWEKDLALRKMSLEAKMANDTWANMAINSKIGCLMTSHPGNRAYLKASIESHKKLNMWITLAYDNHLNPCNPNLTMNDIMPANDVLYNVDLLLVPHHQTWGGVLYPWFWLMKWGTMVMQQFEYIYCINGDFVIEKPEGFPLLMEKMGDADIISYYRDSRSVATCFVAKRECLLKIMDHMEKHFIPFENYEKYTQEFGNAEGRFSRAIKDLGFKLAECEPSCNDQMHLPGYGSFYELIGLRHVHGEHNYAYKYGRDKKLPPPPLEYFDSRYMGGEYNIIKSYHETKDISVLEDWWAK